MTDTPDKAAKKAHAAAIDDALTDLMVLVDSEAETTWWGGLPPALTQLKGMLTLQQNLIVQTFDLTPPEA